MPLTLRFYNRSMRAMSHVQSLLRIADIYCAAKGVSRARVSTIVFNDGKILDRLASGSDLYTGRYERALRWFSDNWPAKTKWPIQIPRPAPAEPA